MNILTFFLNFFTKRNAFHFAHKKKRNYLLILLCLLCFTQVLSAQEKKFIYGQIANSLTKEKLKNAKAELLLPDSTVIDSTRTKIYNPENNTIIFIFLAPKEGNYILRFSNEGYESSYANIKIKLYNRQDYIELGTFYIKKKPKIKEHQLKEVNVTATKIKFYSNKDTIVYNADAFQLSEGSMLDALIAQLPGVELKEDGRILVNGKFVSSLLLNGKDFFKKDRKVMLENLGAYMVNTIKVYEKESDLSKFMGRNVDKKEFVMDVRLKREYSIGWIGNAETAAGSEDRYMARFFGLRFTRNSRISFFGNLNNLNEIRTPGKDGEWSPSDMTDGLQATKMGGIDYNVEDKEGKCTLEGSAGIAHYNTDNKTNSSSVNFLTGGDTYGKSQNISNSDNTEFQTYHKLKIQNKRIFFLLTPELSYSKYNNHSSYLSGTFSEDPSGSIPNGILDSLSEPNAGAVLRRIAINRIRQSNVGSGYSLNTRLNSLAYIKLKRSDDAIQLSNFISYANSKNDEYSHYQLDYPSGTSSIVDYRNQYYHTPNQNYNYSLQGAYILRAIKRTSITPYYAYQQSYNSNERSLYRLDQLNGWDENATERELGALPSTTDSLQSALDTKNSYYSREYNFAHETGVNIYGTKYLNSKKDRLVFNIQIPLHFETNRLNYERAALDTTFSRHVFLFNPSIELDLFTHKDKREMKFNYSKNSYAPSMTYLLNIRDDSDPLYITLGNSNLKNTHTHNFSFYYANQLKEQKLISSTIAYSVTQNAVAMGYVYDKSTGVRTATPDNVNGNWNSSLDINFSTPLNKSKRLIFSTYSRAAYYHSVDLVNVTGVTTSNRSTVGSLYVTETLKADYQFNSKTKIGAKIKGVWTHATSTREDFTTINAGDFNYGLTGQVELPWNMQLGTDLTEYSRRGYEDHSMNTNELVWNARLSKRVLHNKLTFMLDGFDILGNLSNVRRTINAQGRTESYYNVIPSYVMLHAIYRLNIQPKKKG